MKEKNLTGKIKTLSYVVAFIVMLTAHMTIEGLGKENNTGREDTENCSDKILNSTAKVHAMFTDSMYVNGNENVVLLFK